MGDNPKNQLKTIFTEASSPCQHIKEDYTIFATLKLLPFKILHQSRTKTIKTNKGKTATSKHVPDQIVNKVASAFNFLFYA